ncbi:BLUF domain-containing protein [Aurantiacibacter aquimixticola]|uniref:BLUF domain-containing protein n=1 Tax=Aurantiacibacter aquimixticola TaxID=1958945 RepID=A0A419RUW3_9SPHN|nr:BLUF domain-containing protein [Aurantiacibacter aquimixticola]RJY09576.1 BLUF domain-containing protein [Aurantiacibacter aquimixticola]
MRQVLYISTAPGLSESDVDAILQSSRRNNPAAGITGFLIYNGRNFIQLLEGEEARVFALLRKLSYDPRHTGIVKLASSDVGARTCPDWSMQRIRLNQDVDARSSTLDGELPEALAPQIRRIVLNFVALN